ncbi:MAG: tyrosine-protein phosphatase [Phycisphaerales bacterium]
MEKTRILIKRWLIRNTVFWGAMLAALMPGCQHSALIPLGTNNNTRTTSTATAAAATAWAAPVERPGLSNFYKVSDDLYRGAQPTAEGVQQLQALGVKTVINLRDGDTDKGLSIPPGMAYELIRMTAWHASDDDVVQFLRVMSDKSRLPAFVHCLRGADRTGMMVAIYRVAVQGWDKEQAIAEMTEGGFRFNSGWQNLVKYVRDMDVNAIKQKAGIKGLATTN